MNIEDSVTTSINLKSGSIQTYHEESYSHRTRDRFLSSIKSLRNASSKSIRDLVNSGNEDRNNNAFVAGYNVTNLVQGIGILGVPYAVAQGSYIGLLAIFVTAFVACSTGKILIECLYDEDGLRVRKTYSCIGESVWSKYGKRIVTFVSLVEMFGGNTLYVILLSVEGQKILTSIFKYEVSIYYCTLILTYAASPLFFLKKLSIVSWFSFTAVIGLAGTIITMCSYCFYHINSLSWSHFPGISVERIPLSLGIITFSYCAHAAFPGIEGTMKKPSLFPKMMNSSFTISAIVKAIMPLLFVLIYGLNTDQQASNNLELGKFRIVLSAFIIINTFFSLPLTMFVVCERVDAMLLPHFDKIFSKNGKLNTVWLIYTRTTVITASIFVAMIIPHFGLLMGLVGSLTGSCLTFIFPCLFSLKLHKYKLTKGQKVYRYVVIIVGVIMGIAGAIVSTIDIIKTFYE